MTNDQRMVDVGFLNQLQEICDSVGLALQSDKLKNIISGPGVEPVALWQGANEWEQLAYELCAEEHGEESCHDLIWDGGYPPEPWGERWQKYEGEAKRMIELVRKYAPSAPVQAVPDWQPIETAPKDGTHITLTNRRDLPATCHWFDGAWHLSMNRYGPFSQWTWDAPTHWMPLPQPPKESTAQSSAVACPTDKEK